MSQPPPPADGKTTRPEVNYTQEVRFAVVMYGGSSLAIYMNGVAQELLRLVRSTAPERVGAGVGTKACFSDAELDGSESVYRQLGRMLARGEGQGGAAGIAGEGAALRTRFVVDVLTGTSAGGINAVYLAKALANDQSLDRLMGLWVEKGDIDVLLNEPASARVKVDGGERRLDFEGQPRSPLNSPLMYWELLDALRGMDTQGADKNGGPRPLYAEELDLYVTATDTRGRVVNMRLADKVVQELRHRNVFHFRYRGDEGGREVNDFTQEYNAFLAFAARCTSAHQAAFEVMNMDSGGETVEQTGGPRKGKEGEKDELDFKSPQLQKFYEDYLLASGNIKAAGGRAGLAQDFRGRFFNDGGTLDNSPFSFVSEVLPFRQTLHPVDRKLLYVEPSPDHPELTDPGNSRLNFVRNAVAGLSTLPSHQTIVEDLARIQERNRLVERVSHILAGLRKDIGARNRAAHGGRWPTKHGLKALRQMKLSQLIDRHGVSWGGYQRLRIAQVTNDLTLLIARAAGLDEESDEFQAVRYLVRFWRMSRYDDHPAAGSAGQAKQQTEINFLIDFDLSWAIRRVQFLLRTIDELDCLDANAREVAGVAEQEHVKITWPEGDAERREFRDELRRVRDAVNGVYSGLLAERRRLWARRDDPERPNPFTKEVGDLKITTDRLIKLLRLPTEGARAEEIKKYLYEEENLKDGQLKKGHVDEFNTLSEKVQKDFRKVISRAARQCGRLLKYDRRANPLGLADSVRYVLRFYFLFFEDFDQVTFPIFYSTDVGEETDPIEVFRVSPEDASLLVDEKKENEGKRPDAADRVNKLAGTDLAHFAAFFDARYRVNDILWGQLDGAERIISALLPGESDGERDRRERFVREAHTAIIRETAEGVLGKLGERSPALAGEVRAALGGANGAGLSPRTRAALKAQGVAALWRRYLELRAAKPDIDEAEAFRRAFLESYREERAFPPWRKFRLVRKGSAVLKKILRSNLDEHGGRNGRLLSLSAGALLSLARYFALLFVLFQVVKEEVRLRLGGAKQAS